MSKLQLSKKKQADIRSETFFGKRRCCKNSNLPPPPPFCSRDYVSNALYDATNKEAVGVAILIVVLAVSPIIIWLVHNAVATIQVTT
jgi:hypothetical protein